MKTKIKTTALVSPPTSRLGAVRAGRTMLCGLCALLLVFSTRANTTYTWSGGAVPNANWNNSANWGGVGVPGNGDIIIFSGSATNAFVNTNNIVGLTLNQICFIGDNTLGVMFDLRGQPFTLTGSILATNVTGTNIIENSITLATADVLMVVSNNDQLIIKGNLSGSVGVNKAGQGTLTYQCVGNNTYTGTTLVSDGLLQFNVSSVNAVGGPLVIGGVAGGTSPTVEDLQNTEMENLPAVTINSNGSLNLNNFTEASLTTNLTLNSGTITTGSGILYLPANTTISATNISTLSGNVNLNGGTLTLQGSQSQGVFSDTLFFYANLSGSGNILQTGVLATFWDGANTYSGNYTANGSGSVILLSSLALGNINNTMTLNGTTEVALDNNINVANQSLTINSGGIPEISNFFATTNSWTGSFILDTPCTIDVSAGGALTLNGPISGTGSMTKTNGGRLAFTGSTPNTYTNATTVVGGTLQFGKPSTVLAISGSLFIGSNATVRLLNHFQINNPFASITLSNSSLFDLAGFNEWVGPISLQGAQITTGAGLLYLNGNITVNPSLVAVSYLTGNAILWNGSYVVTNSGHSASPDMIISANISSGAAGYGLTKDGLGEVALSGNNTFTGPVTINNGDLWAETSTALGSTNYTATVSNGATLFLAGNGLDFGLKPLILNGPGWIDLINAGLVGAVLCNGSSSWEGNITLAGDTADYQFGVSTLTLAGPISGAGGWQLNGSGTNVFSGSVPNSYAGTTTVNNGTLLLNKSGGAVPGNLVINSPGLVRLANSGQTATTADVLINSGLFDFANNYTIVNTLRGPGLVNFGVGGYILVGYNNGSSEFDGTFAGTGYVTGYTVAKFGTGTFTMGGNSTYTAGITHVFGGKLVVNGNQATIPVTVESIATLGGSGTVGEIIDFGTIDPGNPGVNPAILTSGDVTFSSTANFTVDLTGASPGAGGYDQLFATGPVGTNFLANATLTVVPAFTAPVAVGQYFVILNGVGNGPPCCVASDVISGTFKGLPNGTIFYVDGIGFQISYAFDQVVLTVTSLPAKPVLTGIQRLGSGMFQLTGVGTTNLTYSVWANTNLLTTNWTTIGSVTVPANTNTFQFTDTNLLYYAYLFYRFTWP